MTDLPAAAITAATWALHSRPHGTTNGPCACDSADEHGYFLAEDEAAARAALEAAAPHLAAADPTTETEGFRAYKAGLAAGRAEGAAAERQLLTEAADALWNCAKAALTVKPTLDSPYPDAPEWTPYTRWVERPARQAHDLAMRIRKHLEGTPQPAGTDTTPGHPLPSATTPPQEHT